MVNNTIFFIDKTSLFKQFKFKQFNCDSLTLKLRKLQNIAYFHAARIN